MVRIPEGYFLQARSEIRSIGGVLSEEVIDPLITADDQPANPLEDEYLVLPWVVL